MKMAQRTRKQRTSDTAYGSSETLRQQYEQAMAAYNAAIAAGKSEDEAEREFNKVMGY